MCIVRWLHNGLNTGTTQREQHTVQPDTDRNTYAPLWYWNVCVMMQNEIGTQCLGYGTRMCIHTPKRPANSKVIWKAKIPQDPRIFSFVQMAAVFSADWNVNQKKDKPVQTPPPKQVVWMQTVYTFAGTMCLLLGVASTCSVPPNLQDMWKLAHVAWIKTA